MFPLDEDGVIDNDKLRGYDADKYPFMEEVPPTLRVMCTWRLVTTSYFLEKNRRTGPTE